MNDKTTPAKTETPEETKLRLAQEAQKHEVAVPVKATATSADKHLPALAIEDKKPESPQAALNQAAADKKASAIHDAMKSGWFSGDGDGVRRLLEPLNETERKAVVQSYEHQFGKDKAGSFVQDLKRDLSAGDALKIGTILERKDGRTNDAGNVRLALDTAHGDQSHGNELLRITIGSMNSAQVAAMRAEFGAASGRDNLTKIIQDDKSISPATKEALPYLLKGADQRTAKDVEALANIAVKYGDEKLFKETLSGDSPAVVQGRNNLRNDAVFQSKVNDLTSPVVTGEMVAPSLWNSSSEEILQGGRISLKSIAQADIGLGIFSANKDNISLAVQNATEREKELYSRGEQLARTKSAASPADKEALEFYNGLHKTLAGAGDASEVKAWEDQLGHGRKTVISQLAESQESHWFTAKTHRTQDLMNVAEKLSADDWKFLNQHKDKNDPYWNELRSAMTTYARGDEQTKVIDLLQRKAAAGSFEESQKLARSLSDVIADNTYHNRGGREQLISGGEKNIFQAITTLSPEDAGKYRQDVGFRNHVDSLVKQLGNNEQILANGLLKQAAAGGEVKVAGALSVIQDEINGASVSDRLKHIQEAMQDPETRRAIEARQGSAENKAAAAIIDRVINNQFGSPADAAAYGEYAPINYQSQDRSAEAREALFKTGHLPVALEINSGLPVTENTLKHIAAASPQEQKDALAALASDPNNLALALNSVTQHGKLDLADKVRLFANGSSADTGQQNELRKQLRGELEAAQNSKDGHDLNFWRNEYSRKYGGDMDADLMKKDQDKGDSEGRSMSRIVADNHDSRQKLVDQIGKSQISGMVNDGTDLTLERANREFAGRIQEAQATNKQLNPEELRKLQDFSETSTRQYQESKRALADAAADGAITVGSLAAVPFTGGVSLAGLAMAAGAGAATSVTVPAVVEGKDYSGSKLVHDAAGGAAAQASMFAGGELTAGLFNVGEKVANRTAVAVAKLSEETLKTEGVSLLGSSGEQGLKGAIQKAVQEQLGSGSGSIPAETIHNMATRYAANPGDAKAVAALENAIQLTLKKEIGSTWEQTLVSSGLQGTAFGAGGAANGAAAWDGRQSAEQNLARIGAYTALGFLSGIPAAGLGRLGHGIESNANKGALTAHIADNGSDGVQAINRAITPENARVWMAVSPDVREKLAGSVGPSANWAGEVNTMLSLARKGNLGQVETDQLMGRFAEFKAQHPDFRVNPAESNNKQVMARDLIQQVQENSVASYMMTTHDYANNIMNRAGMEWTLNQMANNRELAGQEAIVLNLAQFKQANDQFDHRTGDLVLKAMSNYLHQKGMDERCAVKLAGDKFVIIGPKGEDGAVKEALKTVQIYPSRDGVVLTAKNADGSQMALKAERTHPDDPHLEGRLIDLPQGYKPPADQKVVVTVADSGENAVRTVATTDRAGQARAVQDILNDIYGNSPHAAPQATLIGISEQAQEAGRQARALAEAARQGLLGRGSISDSVYSLVHRIDENASMSTSTAWPSSVRNFVQDYRSARNTLARELSPDELGMLTAIARTENNAATAAYTLDRGTGLIGKERYEFMLERGVGHNEVSGVIVCDVKGFAGINGATRFNSGLGFNRQVGDVGIDAMSDALRDGINRAGLPKELADKVTLARIGGDEIGLIMPGGMSREEQNKLLKEIDSIRLALHVDSGDHVTVRRIAPGETLKPGEVDIGVAAGHASIESARKEETLRTALAADVASGNHDAALHRLEEAEKAGALPESRIEALKRELAANREGTGGPIEQPLSHILQGQGDAASEHVKKLEKEFLVLNEDECRTAEAMSRVLSGQGQPTDRVAAARHILDGAPVSQEAQASLKKVLDDAAGGQISSDQAAYVLSDRLSFSRAHPEMAAQEIKMSRMHTVGYPQEFQAFEQKEIKALPKEISDPSKGPNGTRTIFVQAREYNGVYTGLDGNTHSGTIAVMSADGKTVLGGLVYDLQNQALAAQKAARDAAGTAQGAKLAEARQKLTLADRLLYQVGESDKYPGKRVRQRVVGSEVITDLH